jgi:hypothetical protein|tara:strand:- start:155 stop:496 length:342 start_codon:yes stop_codon:yes gene_type:complete
MAKETKTTIETITDPPKPEKHIPTVNERIQIVRFWIRAIIALCNISVLAGIIFYLLTLTDSVPETTERILLIIVGPLILTAGAVSKYFFESGNDLEDHATDGNGSPAKEGQSA